MTFISFITLIELMTLILIIRIMVRYVKILELPITCGRTIAKTVDDLGDQFRPAMRAGWLAYIRTAYPDDARTPPQLPARPGPWGRAC